MRLSHCSLASVTERARAPDGSLRYLIYTTTEDRLTHELTNTLMARMERIETEIVAAIDDLKPLAEKDEQAGDLRQRFNNILKEQAAIDRLLHGIRQ